MILCTIVLISNIILVPQTSSFLEKAQLRLAELYRFEVMSTSFTNEITCCTSSFVTRLTFGFFRIAFVGALCLFPAVDTEAEVDTLEAAIPLLEPSK